MGPDQTQLQREDAVTQRQRELHQLRQEIRLARQVRPARSWRRHLGLLLIALGEALRGPTVEAAETDGILSTAARQ